MITLVCATDRPKAKTRSVVNKYADLLRQRGIDHRQCLLEEMSWPDLLAGEYGMPSPGLAAWAAENFESSDRLVIIAPEYNGSYPGAFKLLLDTLPQVLLEGKKAALVGVATGRAGNLRGLDHLTGVLHYLKVEVLSDKVAVSVLGKLLNEQGELIDPETIQRLERQLDRFLKF